MLRSREIFITREKETEKVWQQNRRDRTAKPLRCLTRIKKRIHAGKRISRYWGSFPLPTQVSGPQGTNGTLRTTLPAILLRPKGFQRISKTSVLSNKNSLHPRHLQKIQDATIRLQPNKEEPILTWVQNELWLEWNPRQRDRWSKVQPKGEPAENEQPRLTLVNRLFPDFDDEIEQ